jgi:hypothetical protein
MAYICVKHDARAFCMHVLPTVSTTVPNPLSHRLARGPQTKFANHGISDCASVYPNTSFGPTTTI